eukprot:m.391202 g.391202  ORF g.391202 m.391202 type:complete len:396 (+) comp21073_c1_seq2:109-1296(+)
MVERQWIWLVFSGLIHDIFAVPSASIVGGPQLVWPGGASKGSCADFDIPDSPARAWRSRDGKVHFAASWATWYLSTGNSLDTISKNCSVSFNSTMSGENALYSDHEWLVAPWVLDDNITVMGYAHQEYHGWQHNNCSVTKNQNKFCWMVAMTALISTDGGYTFHHVAEPPKHLVAAAPYQYEPDISGFGYGDPSGIVRNPKDGFVYMTTHSRQNHSALEAGTCIMRTKTPENIASWRGWDGQSFSVSFVDPYANAFVPGTESMHVCNTNSGLDFTVLSLKWSTYYDAFIAVGQGTYVFANGTHTIGYVFALSTDLLQWSGKHFIREMAKDGTVTDNYASVLDPSSSDPNFNDIGEHGYFYFTQTTHGPANTTCARAPGCRDLFRERITFAGQASL